MIKRVEEDEKANYDWLMGEVGNLQKLMQKEMKGKFFLYIQPERARFWPKMNAPHLFGDHVAKAFPSATYDITEAGGQDRSTASVFHLMRVLEIGLGPLGKIFNVSLAHTNWAPAIEEIKSKIRDMYKDPVWKALPDCKEQQEFYAQAASHFGVLKDAWRNYTAHARGKYTSLTLPTREA